MGVTLRTLSWLDLITDEPTGESADRKQEPRNDNPNDIASDEEAYEDTCQCLIHSKRKSKQGLGHDLFYKQNGGY
jgi:hypothetical protein